jgi:enoyl-CoA hydratase
MTAAAFTCLRLEREGDVLRVTIDHPNSKINAVDEVLHHDLTALFRLLKQEDEARAILLTGSKGVFSAGGNMEWFRTFDTPRRVFDLHRDAKQMIWDLLDVQLPIVAAVNGHAMGLGANLALFCDVIFMAHSARIADPHVKAGIVAGDGGTAIWPMTIGPARAKEYLLTGDALTAADAERLGLINHAVPDDELDGTAMAFARRLAAGAPMAVQYTKVAVNKLIKEALNVSFDAATGYEMVTMLSQDRAEAVDSFLNRRTPAFKGL